MSAALQFIKEAYYELKKSSWLSRKDAVGSTVVVIVLVVILSFYISGVDKLLSIILGAIF